MRVVWSEFAEVLMQDSPTLANILGSLPYELKENYMIEIGVSNNLLENAVLEGRVELLKFLRNRLRNDNIDFQIKITEIKIEAEKLLYTFEDKFKHLNDKNPSLMKLKQAFNLDYD